MNSHFARLMRAATQSTVQGDLGAATRTIQQALAGQSTSQDADPDPDDRDQTIIDTRFREVPQPQTAGEIADEFHEGEGNQSQLLRGVHRTASGSRKFRLFLPAPSTTQRRPMLVMLHGCTQQADDFALGTEMDEIANRNGVIVLYPEQSKQDNPNGCWNWFQQSHQQRNLGECAILADMVRTLSAKHGVTSDQIYVAGLSAGGAMAVVLADQYPELFQAVGVHSGLPAGQAKDLPSALKLMSRGRAGSSSARPGTVTPTIVFHGTADRTVNEVNGQDVFSTAVGRAASQSLPLQTETGQKAGRSYTRTVCPKKTGQPLHEHWAVHGAGHAWSGGNPAGSFADPAGPVASSEMMRFFLSHE